ncbi:integrase catalytic domain-containing protein [Trichonephila clavipes]|nr:integrase catalytic domain-containing protein [Trichonephila clavipes]
MNYYNANNEDNINVKNNKGLDQVPDSPEADLKRLFNPAMVVEDTVPKQTSEQWGDLTQLLDKFQTIFSQNKYDVGCINLEPQRIHLISDLPISLRPYRNSQQESKEIQTQIEELLKAANRPQCNGKNERVNQTLVAKLRCKVNSTTKTPWTKLLEQVTYEYNNSPHDVTGFPPAYLMFGTLPYDSPLPNQVKLNYPPIQQARQIAVNRTIKHHKINKQRYDKHYVDAKFKVGDLVLYQNFSYPNSSKLQSPYNGPFKVVRKLSNVTYEIDKPNQYTGKLTDIVHSTRLKPFHSKSNFQLC